MVVDSHFGGKQSAPPMQDEQGATFAANCLQHVQGFDLPRRLSNDPPAKPGAFDRWPLKGA